MLASLADQGDINAFVELGLWFLEGRMVRRDLARSRDLFEEAARRGHADAIAVTSAFCAVGIGGNRDWNGSLKWLEIGGHISPALAEERRLVLSMPLDAGGEPHKLIERERISDDPAIFWVRQFLTHDECRFLIERARPHLSPSVIIDPTTGSTRPDPVRTSHNAFFPWMDETPFIHALNRRVAQATGTLVECGEPLQVLNYSPGQEYRRHSDAIAGESNQRILTALIYLNDDFDGGATEFPELNLILKGCVGDLLVFRNADADNRPHPQTHHLGAPVISGCKWLASRWIRQTAFGNRL